MSVGEKGRETCWRESVEIQNVWMADNRLDCRWLCMAGWSPAKVTQCFCDELLLHCLAHTREVLLSCCCRSTIARPWRSTTSSTSSATSAWRGQSGRKSWGICSRLLCRWSFSAVAKTSIFWENIYLDPVQDPTELSKNSVGRNKREINLQVGESTFDHQWISQVMMDIILEPKCGSSC